MTFRDFKEKVKQEIFPSGEAENLVAAHDANIIEALIDIQRWVPCLQENNVSVHDFCSTFFDCGATVVEAPTGVVKKVYTVAEETYCDPVFLTQTNHDHLRCWTRELTYKIPPVNGTGPALPLGVRNANKTTDHEKGRSLLGNYAIHNGRLYVAPWIQSNEVVCVEWDGIKRKWGDGDPMSEGMQEPDVVQAVKSYVQACHARDWLEDLTAYRLHWQQFLDQRATLSYDCREKTRTKQQSECAQVSGNLYPVAATVDTDADDHLTVRFAVIGSYGDSSEESRLVSEIVKGWSPHFIITTGDNNIGAGTTITTIDDRIGKMYSDYIHPYAGKYSNATTENKFFPCVDKENLDLFYRYFKIQAIGVGGVPSGATDARYYDVVKGSCHFFFLNSLYDEDGEEEEDADNSATSEQAEWLRVKLLLSTAKWKIVIIHHPPYSNSSDTGPFTALRWPFKTWGASMVFSGHAKNYERLNVVSGDEGLTYFVNGAGGATVEGFESAPANSYARFEGNGAQLCEAGCDTFSSKFYDRDGNLIDTYEVK